MSKAGKTKQKTSKPYSEKKQIFTDWRNGFSRILLFLSVLLLPTQLGKHFFLPFAYLSGVRVDYLAPTLYITDILITLLVLINFKAVIDFLTKKAVLFFLLLLVPNILFAQSFPSAIYKTMKILELLVFAFMAYRTVFRKKTLLGAFLVSGILQLILAISQFLAKQSIQGLFYFLGERYMTLSTPGIAKASINGVEILRPYATFSHPNSMGGFFLVVYLFFLVYKPFNRYLLLKYLSLFVFSCLVFLSFSKIAITAYILLTAYFVIISSKRPCRICVIARVITIIAVGLIFMQAQTDPLTIQKRVELIGNSIKIIAQYPLTGVGPGNYLIAQNQLSSKFPFFFNQPVHNIFLLLLAEFGIPLGAYILFSFFRLLKKNLTTYLLIPLFAVFITGLFDHYWFTLQQNWLLLGWIAGISLKEFTRFEAHS